MEKLLVSACLAGEKTRYDGNDNAMPDLIDRLAEYFDLVFVCPETMGGLPTPRDPSEIKFGTIVVSSKGKDVTAAFVKGASEALRIASFFGIRFAVLKEGSPSCGISEIHDGSFSGKKIKGMGFTARKLQEAGLKLFNEETAEELLQGLAKRDQSRAERDRIREARKRNAESQEREQHQERRPYQERSERKPRRDDGERKSYGGRTSRPKKDFKGKGPRFGKKRDESARPSKGRFRKKDQ